MLVKTEQCGLSMQNNSDEEISDQFLAPQAIVRDTLWVRK